MFEVWSAISLFVLLQLAVPCWSGAEPTLPVESWPVQAPPGGTIPFVRTNDRLPMLACAAPSGSESKVQSIHVRSVSPLSCAIQYLVFHVPHGGCRLTESRLLARCRHAFRISPQAYQTGGRPSCFPGSGALRHLPTRCMMICTDALRRTDVCEQSRHGREQHMKLRGGSDHDYEEDGDYSGAEEAGGTEEGEDEADGEEEAITDEDIINNTCVCVVDVQVSCW
eukprot:1814249-Rhodomonas_salina.1